MSILREIGEKIKQKVVGFSTDRSSHFWDDVVIIVIIFLVSLASFGLGRLSVTYSQNTTVTEATSLEPLGEVLGEDQVVKGGYVASKKGTKYHFPWCSGAQTMSEENKIYFDTKEEAEAAGYTPAANCEGL